MTQYRPANGTEAGIFECEWCDNCARETKFRETLDGDDACVIAIRAFVYEADDERYPAEWCYQDGKPVCTAFHPIGRDSCIECGALGAWFRGTNEIEIEGHPETVQVYECDECGEKWIE